jgi:NAD(P) transhydrogenase subunit alpha
MIVGVACELYPPDRRVALVPAVVPGLAKAGLEVLVERGAGRAAGFTDAEYEQQGARLEAERDAVFASAEILVRVKALDSNEGAADLKRLRPGQVLLGLLNPLGAPQAVREVAERGVTAFALELLPRIARAQPMDALTSMATIAGYKAAIIAAGAIQKLYPMMITAAGTIAPARVLVIGAGVAGLQAIATSRRLGAVVQAYDVRPAVKEQVESLGAKFLELGLETQEAEAAGGYARAMEEDFYRRQQALMTRAVAESNVVITTAAVPGKRAPVLITEQAVREMRPGSVIIDLAAESGGNCELTRPGETVEVDGATIVGPLNLPATVPYDASQMYARNLTAFLQNLVKAGEMRLNLEDLILRDTLVAHQGEVVSAPVRELLGKPPQPAGEERRS